MSGALIFVDEMFAPMPHPMVNGTHVIIYNTKDQQGFNALLRYYVGHPDEARAMAKRGYLHTLRYHRTVSRVDYFMRTAHHEELVRSSHPQAGGYSPEHVTEHEHENEYEHTGRAVIGDFSKTMAVSPRPANWVR
eukprot:CAMPEP_0172629878 /NCGR_PEP_ID=MMETSP1068-20121228/170368_1 /TAXON_ID=35684 /ORGANISM="Pseudopedinella elastica, Strain CCMP716" /LENGTH=134 /DNA_ID=CAMNT_0013440539 /DNA_START=60 /DNA_END=464 /DNA_ORIENTATION=-